MNRLFYVFLLIIVTVGAVSTRKSDNSSISERPAKFRKSKLFYNFWIPLKGGPTQPSGGTTPSPVCGGVPCNTATIITTPCSCGGPICEMGRTCIDPGTTMTCTTPTICTDMVISTAVACTCGTGAAAEVCTAGQFCNANAAMNRCTRLPDCLATGRYSMAMPCRCGMGTTVCGLGVAVAMAEGCIVGTGQCRQIATTCENATLPANPVTNAPCLCSTGATEVVCPETGRCAGPALNDLCVVPVPTGVAAG